MNIFDFLTPKELEAAQKSVEGMKRAASEFDFHLAVLKTFTLDMQMRMIRKEQSNERTGTAVAVRNAENRPRIVDLNGQP